MVSSRSFMSDRYMRCGGGGRYGAEELVEGLRVWSIAGIIRGSTGSLSRLSMPLGSHGRTWGGVAPSAVRGRLLGRSVEVEWVGM